MTVHFILKVKKIHIFLYKNLTNFLELSPWREVASCAATTENFMETEGSLLCLQEPSTGPCPEPDECILYTTPSYL
jgi:hypothetical protein